MTRKLQSKHLEAIRKIRSTLKEQSQMTYDTSLHNISIDEDLQQSIYHRVFKEQHLKNAKIVNCNLRDQGSGNKQFANYVINVEIEQFTYDIQRRYSEFYNFYKKLNKNARQSLQFPKKTYNPFFSSVSQKILEERRLKLNCFLKKIIELVYDNKLTNEAYHLFGFLKINQKYQNNSPLSSNFIKSQSENLQFKRFNSIKSHLSQRKITKQNEKTLQFQIILLNENNNTTKHLLEIQQILKQKKSRITNQQIKMVLLGFDDYKGLIRYGLTSQIEINRIKSLQFLFHLYQPEKNFYYQKYEKAIEKIPLSGWKVENIYYFDNTQFKILYFKLLNIYCDKVQKQANLNQKSILKELFMFHSEHYNDYFHWKKIKENSENLISQMKLEHTQRFDIESFDSEDSLYFKELKRQEKLKSFVLFNQNSNTLIFKLQSCKKVQLSILQWNRFIQNFKKDEITECYKCVSNNDYRQSLKLKIENTNFTSQQKTRKSSFQIDNFPNEIKQIIQNSKMKHEKKQHKIQKLQGYKQQIWIQEEEQFSRIVILIRTAKRSDIFSGSLQKYHKELFQDAANYFY